VVSSIFKALAADQEFLLLPDDIRELLLRRGSNRAEKMKLYAISSQA